MADPYTIDELIADHSQDLTLSWLTHSRPGALSSPATMQYWIGEYHPEQHHLIEIVHRDNYSQLSQSLAHGGFYLAAGLETARPNLLIFTEDLACDYATLQAIQKLGIAALHTPMQATFILRELAYALAQSGTHAAQHGVMLSIFDQGVLLTGASGLGKSAIALELISRGHRLIADDAPLMHRLPTATQVFALCPPLLADFLEVRTLGILNIGKLFGPHACAALAPVQLVIELVETLSLNADKRLQPYSGRTSILGMDIPCLQLPVSHVTNLAVLVETATKNHVLYTEGYDANASLAQRQQELINKQPV